MGETVKVLAILWVFLIGALQVKGGQPISIGEVAKIHSKILGEERTLLISTPLNYQGTSEPYPVLYMTDGGDHLIHLRGTVNFLARNGLMPEVIIVGITSTNQRTRDLTPTPAFTLDAKGTKVNVPNSGGANGFLDFFEKELFPYIESNYRTAPFRIFAGHSFGGLLALHTMVTRPDCFHAYIAASPSLDWDGDYPLRTVMEFFKGRKDFRRTLYVTMGDEEAGQPRPTHFDRLRSTLSRVKAEGFSWDSKALPEESHGSVVLLSYYWGLRKVFEDWKLPFDKRTGHFEGTLKDLQHHYLKVSQRLGYALLPPEGVVNLVGYQALNRKQFQDAIAIFRFNVQTHSASSNAHDSLGEALEKAGSISDALVCYQTAVDLGKASGSPFLSVFTRNRDRVGARVKAP